MSAQPPLSVLFVCTGNICRSPTAEGVLRHMLAKRGLSMRLDSAGVASYHIGEAPDPRSQATSLRAGIDISDLRARKLTPSDFTEFDVIFAMDEGHLEAIRRVAPPGATAELALYLPYAGIPVPHDMPDPYYGKQAGFDLVLSLCQQATEQLIARWWSA